MYNCTCYSRSTIVRSGIHVYQSNVHQWWGRLSLRTFLDAVLFVNLKNEAAAESEDNENDNDNSLMFKIVNWSLHFEILQVEWVIRPTDCNNIRSACHCCCVLIFCNFRWLKIRSPENIEDRTKLFPESLKKHYFGHRAPPRPTFWDRLRAAADQNWPARSRRHNDVGARL